MLVGGDRPGFICPNLPRYPDTCKWLLFNLTVGIPLGRICDAQSPDSRLGVHSTWWCKTRWEGEFSRLRRL